MSIADIDAPESGVDPKSQAKQVQTGEEVVFEQLVAAKDGRRIPVEIHARAFRLQGRLAVYSVARDITERKRAGEAASAASARLRATLESISDGFYVLDQNLIFTYLNSAAERLLNRPRQDVIGRNVLEAFPRVRGSIIQERFEQALREQQPLAFEAQLGAPPDEAWYDFHVYPQEGGISVYFQVTTDRKRAELALRESEAKFRALFDSAGDAMFIRDLEGRFLEVNRVACERLGYTREEFRQMTPKDIDRTVDTERLAECTERALRGEHVLFETAQARRDGAAVPTELNIRVLDYGGKPAILGIARDITERRRGEQVLRESEARYRDVVERANEGIVVIQDGIVRFVNARAVAMIGGTVECVKGSAFTDHLYPDDLPRVAEYYRRRMNGEDVPATYEAIMRRKDGSPLPTELTASRVNYDGRPADLVFIRDIAERKQAEAALRESEEKYRVVVENSSEAIVVAQEGIVRFANRRASELVERPIQDIINLPFVELIHQEDRALVQDRHQRRLKGETQPEVYAFRIVSPGGTERWVEINVETLDWQGRTATLNFLTEITERRRTQAAVREAEERYRRLFEEAVEGIYQTTPEGEFIRANPALARMLGFDSPEEMIAATSDIGAQIYAEPAQRVEIKRLLARGEPVRGFETQLRRQDGKLVWVSIFAGVMRDPSTNEPFYQGSMIDITELKEVEAERERLSQVLAKKNEELEQMLYSVSHDLRSPLVTVQGFTAELGLVLDELRAKLDGLGLSEGSRTEIDKLLKEVPESIGFIKSGTTKMSALLDSLLKMSRLGRVTLEIQTLDMNLLLAQVTSALQFSIAQAGARLEVSPLPACRGDAGQVDQVFANLIGNAVKYRDPDRPLEIKVTGRTEEGKGEGKEASTSTFASTSPRVVYCVEDNGIGIPPEFHERAFMLFQQVHPKSSVGEGLGLAIVKRIVDRLGGRVWLESELGKGSRFFVELPGAE
jgi:PAS domain S-box-containing protein